MALVTLFLSATGRKRVLSCFCHILCLDIYRSTLAPASTRVSCGLPGSDRHIYIYIYNPASTQPTKALSTMFRIITCATIHYTYLQIFECFVSTLLVTGQQYWIPLPTTPLVFAFRSPITESWWVFYRGRKIQ